MRSCSSPFPSMTETNLMVLMSQNVDILLASGNNVRRYVSRSPTSLSTKTAKLNRTAQTSLQMIRINFDNMYVYSENTNVMKKKKKGT